jgi:hypothetical protein
MSTEQIALINLITTIVLCIVTGVYVIITNQMRKDQRRQLEISNRPYFSFDRFVMGIEKEGSTITALQPQLHFKNVGNVILEYNIEELEFIVNTLASTNNQLHSNGGYVFPKMDALFYFPHEKSFNSTTLKEKNDIIVRYKLSYKTTGTKISYTSEKKLEFQFYLTSEQISGILYKDQKET